MKAAEPGMHDVRGRDNFCRGLHAYKETFRNIEGWMAVVDAVARIIGREPADPLRMVEDFEQESGQVISETSGQRGIRPAAPEKYPPVVQPAHGPAPAPPAPPSASPAFAGENQESQRSIRPFQWTFTRTEAEEQRAMELIDMLVELLRSELRWAPEGCWSSEARRLLIRLGTALDLEGTLTLPRRTLLPPRPAGLPFAGEKRVPKPSISTRERTWTRTEAEEQSAKELIVLLVKFFKRELALVRKECGRSEARRLLSRLGTALKLDGTLTIPRRTRLPPKRGKPKPAA